MQAIFWTAEEVAQRAKDFYDQGIRQDYLTLPPQAVSVMNLPLDSSMRARLADGSQVLLPIHLATIVWGNVEKIVLILASGYNPLLGTAMMKGII